MTATTEAPPCVQAAPLRAFITRSFVAASVLTEDATTLAELMVLADLRGTDTHGVIRLPLYTKRLRAGGVNARPNFRTLREKPSAALIDGDNGMGHLVMRHAAQVAIDKANKTGVGWVGMRMSNYAGPAALYAMVPLARDMIGLYLGVGSNNHLPPWGSSETLLGTNPLAIAIPAQDEPPVFMDMSPTVAAFGKVRLKARRNESMPVGWMVDRNGQPLTDAKRADEGFLLPIGEYKGYALSLMIGLLAGVLNSAAFGRDIVDFTKQVSSAINTGQAIVAVSVETFMPPAEFRRMVDAAVRDIRNAQRLPGVERILLPGEQSHYKHQDWLTHGVLMPKPLRDSLDTVARDLDIAALE